MIARTCGTVAIDVHVLIRPRAGDFCYSDLEFDVMQHDIDVAKSLGAEGVVIGALNPDGTINRAPLAQLIARARPMRVTFHRAFDLTPDPFTALETLAELGVDFVLTSGRQPHALAGLPLLESLADAARGRIRIIAGGGLTAEDVPRIVASHKIRDVHLHSAATTTVRSPMNIQGASFAPVALDYEAVDREKVRRIVESLQGAD
jgi:copper homeostasis protein